MTFFTVKMFHLDLDITLYSSNVDDLSMTVYPTNNVFKLVINDY